jgi:hypothetical protein
MAKKSVKAVYIGSDDYWQFDTDSYNNETQFYGSAWVVPAEKVTEKLMEEGDVSRCQMYFEVGRTDGHLFTPTTIIFDEKNGFLLIKGAQGRIGQPENTTTKTKAFALGQLAQRYKNLTESASSKAPARFMVNYIIADDTDDKSEIQAFVEELNGDGEETEEVTVAEAETTIGQMEAENMEIEEMNAEEMNAENLPRVNPVVVEGAEDVHGAEEGYDSDGMADPAIFGEFVNDNIVGQDFNGQVIGQAAEEGYSSDGMADPEVFGEFVNDNVIGQDFNGQVIGQAAEEGYRCVKCKQDATEDYLVPKVGMVCDGCMSDADFKAWHENNKLHNPDSYEAQENMVESQFGDVGEGNNFGQMRAESHDYSPDDYSPFDNPEDFDPRMMEADDIVEWFQELPVVDRFRLNGWAASALVVGIAALSGSWFSKRR